MSLAGFKKQFNKANQYVNEKIAGAKGTELDDSFIDMEKKIDVMSKLVEDLMTKTQEMLQPNPASRAKMNAMKSMSKLRGQHNTLLYPQPEGVLGDCMIKHGKDLGSESVFGQALTETGEGYKQIADFKYALEDSVKQNFIDPLLLLGNKDLKEVNHHRKKLTGRRLDYDCKKRKQSKDGLSSSSGVTEDELRQAEEKFEESKHLAETAMLNLLENDAEQVSQLASFVESELNFHQQTVDVLQSVLAALRCKSDVAANRPKTRSAPQRVASVRSTSSDERATDIGLNVYKAQPTTYTPDSPDLLGLKEDPVYSVVHKPSKGYNQPCVEALYDFEPANEGEIGFKEGDIIKLVSHVDENWLEGSINGQTGLFPVTYVKIIVDLP